MPQQRIQISNLAYWVALAALFTWGAWLRMRAPLDPIADPDVWGYLSPAVSKLVGGGFTHAGRNFVYPGFLYLLLRWRGDFRVIAFAQHALGLLAGVVMLLIWQRVRDLIVRPRLPAAVHRWLGLLPVGIYLLAADTIRFELQIRPEGICGFLGILNVYLVLQFIYWFFVRENKRAAVLYGIGTVVSALLLGSCARAFGWLRLARCFHPAGAAARVSRRPRQGLCADSPLRSTQISFAIRWQLISRTLLNFHMRGNGSGASIQC